MALPHDHISWQVDCWFDPSCPLTWLTTQWLRGLAERHMITIDWHLMSLSVLNEDLVEAGSSDALDQKIRESRAAGVALVGPGLGTPVVRIRDGAELDRAFFGPVIIRPLDSDEAVRLWQGVTGLATVAAFTELKTGR